MTSPTPITAAPGFYRRRPIYRDKTFDVADGDESYSALWVKFRINLTYGEIDAIPYSRNALLQEAWEAMAPHVVAWNVSTIDPDTGEPVPVPPPAEGGWEVFSHLDAVETTWLLQLLKFAHLVPEEGEEERAKISAESASMPETSSDSDSAKPE